MNLCSPPSPSLHPLKSSLRPPHCSFCQLPVHRDDSWHIAMVTRLTSTDTWPSRGSKQGLVINLTRSVPCTHAHTQRHTEMPMTKRTQKIVWTYLRKFHLLWIPNNGIWRRVFHLSNCKKRRNVQHYPAFPPSVWYNTTMNVKEKSCSISLAWKIDITTWKGEKRRHGADKSEKVSQKTRTQKKKGRPPAPIMSNLIRAAAGAAG